ncbi:MAG TPA: hypothetical protein PKA39_12950 [Ignavibacteria bacterium]|nr:hypothetical protein [Ignavibacteria bacterium]
MYKKLTIILAVILTALAADRVIFTSSDVKIDVSPEVLRASVNSEVLISVKRVNILGFEVPFSKVDAAFVIEDGANLVEFVGEPGNSSVKVRSKGLEGEAAIGIYSVRSGMQIRKVLLKILPRDVAANQ